MNGPEHYREAEQILAATFARIDRGGVSAADAQYNIARAQVHATLALAAATAVVVIEESSSVETAPEWREVTR